MTITINNPSVTSALKVGDIQNQILSALMISELDALERYTIARQLKTAITEVTSMLTDEAINLGYTYDGANDGKEFQHKGCYYNIQHECDYNYGEQKIGNVPDPNSVQWKECISKIKKCKSTMSDWDDLRKGYEKIIRNNHPNMEEINPSVVLKFNAKKSGSDA